MKVTFILKDLSEAFYFGNGGSIAGLSSLPDAEKLAYLFRRASERELQITAKVGNGSFRDRLGLNSMLKKPHSITFKIEPRRGYKLATFEIK